jgi:hypothetical protein
MSYLYIIFQQSDSKLYAEYCLSTAHFRVTNMSVFYSISAAIQSFYETQTEFEICCTTFSPLQNGKKISEKKS